MMDDPTGYGRVIRDAHGRVRAVVEQKAGTPEQLAIREANMGIYCYRADLFWKHVDEIRPNNPAQRILPHRHGRDPESRRALRGSDADRRRARGARHQHRGWNWREVDRLFRDRKLRELMLAGVTIEKPETVTIDAGVQIGMDTIVEPFAQIRGRTVIGENCRIGSCSIIEDSEIGDEVEIGAFTIVGTSRLERGAHAGPFARLRMENHVEEGAHIGNFVELKKTRMGAGAKASHLAYLGDSRDRRQGEHRRRHDHLQLRRLQEAPDADRRGGVRRQQFDAGGADRHRAKARMSRRGR